MEPVIQINNIGKKYNISHLPRGYVSLRDVISEIGRKPFSFLKRKVKTVMGKMTKEDFWALRDVNFNVNRGEAIGIIGPNGAGKSTLLKILSQITPPTEGSIKLRGKVASLLEVGTGFHPELTGRENIFLNAAILGMTRREIIEKFDDIVAFAGVEKFIDTQVKRYSSGMYVRLAFAVAAHIEPDILLVDEVLAVGDAEFQKKCLGKMEEAAGKAGRTIIFVSHNMSAIQKLCSRCVLLQKGRVVMIGETSKVIAEYLSHEAANRDETDKLFPLTDKDVVLNGFGIEQKGIKTGNIDGDEPFEIKIDFETLTDMNMFRAGVYVKNSLGDTVIRSFTSDWTPRAEQIKKGRYQAKLVFPDKLLMPGSYSLELHISRFAIFSYFSKYKIEKTIVIGPSAHFNQAHPTEKIGAGILMKNEWSLQNMPQ